LNLQTDIVCDMRRQPNWNFKIKSYGLATVTGFFSFHCSTDVSCDHWRNM